MQQKVVHAGANSVSYQQGFARLAELSDLKVAPKPVERMARKIRQERTDQRDAAVKTLQRLPLMAKDVVANSTRPCPKVAMVSVDGGRMHIRSKPSNPSKGLESPKSLSWKPIKARSIRPIRPDVPWRFLDLKRTKERVRGLGHALPVGLEFGVENRPANGTRPVEEEVEICPARASPGAGSPSVLASRKCAEDFGPMVHQAAWERNFFGARALGRSGERTANRWTIQRRHFASFTPILDFVHALGYVFSAAFAEAPKRRGGALQAVDSSRLVGPSGDDSAGVGRTVRGTGSPSSRCARQRPSELGLRVVAAHLRNNADKMRYDHYRCQGLPIMTSAVESVIKMINRRVKGSEKFWSDPGAEAILQLRADYLSETETMSRFWLAREADASNGRPYRRAS